MRGVEAAAKKAGHDVKVPFSPGRTDASQETTDVESFAVLEPTADGFRNYLRKGDDRPAAELLVDRANLLTLTAPEMTVLLGRLPPAAQGQLRAVRSGSLHQATRVTDQRLLCEPARHQHPVAKILQRRARLRGVRQPNGAVKWTGTAVDLLFGSNAQLRAIAEFYACDDSQRAFVRDFVAAVDKVMNLDRFDLVAARTS